MLILSLLVWLPLSGAWIFPPYYDGSANDGMEYSCVDYTFDGWLAIQNTPLDFNVLNISREISDADSHEKRDFEAVEVPDSMINDNTTEESVSFGFAGDAFITDPDYDPENKNNEGDVESDPDFVIHKRDFIIPRRVRRDMSEEEDSAAEDLEETDNNRTETNVPRNDESETDEDSFWLKLEIKQEGRRSNKDLLYPGQMAQVSLSNFHNKAPITFFISVSAYDEGDEAGAFGDAPRLRKAKRRSGCGGGSSDSHGHGHNHPHGHGHYHPHGHEHHHSHGHGHHHSHGHGHHHSHGHEHHHSEDDRQNQTHTMHEAHDHGHHHHHHHHGSGSSSNVNHTHDHDSTHHHSHPIVIDDEELAESNDTLISVGGEEDGVESIVVDGINTDGTGLIDLRITVIDTLNPFVEEEENVEKEPFNFVLPMRRGRLRPIEGEVASCAHVVQGWVEGSGAVEIDYMPPEQGCVVIRAYASYPLDNDGSLILTSEANEEYLQIFDCVAPNVIPREDRNSEDYQIDLDVLESPEDDSSSDEESESSEEGHGYNLRPRNKRTVRYMADRLDDAVSVSTDDDSVSAEDDSESTEDDSESAEDSESSEEGDGYNLSPRFKRDAESLSNDFDENTNFIERELKRMSRQERKKRRSERKENKKNRKNRRKNRKNRRRNEANGNSTSAATDVDSFRNRHPLKNITDKGERFCCKEGILHKKASTYETEEGTMPVLECDSVPAEVILWGAHKHQVESSTCEVRYKGCCDAFDVEMWKKWLEDKKKRRQRRRRRMNKNKRRNRANRNKIN